MLRIVILIGALAAGGGAAWLATTMRTLSSVQDAGLPEVQSSIEVLVAAVAMTQGAILQPEALMWQPWPQESLAEGYILRSAQPEAPTTLAGQLTRFDLGVGEPIRADRLARGEGGLLSVMLRTGERAIAVRVTPQTAAGGFILPGDRVDVVRTFSRPGAFGQTEMVSETILRNIRVLAIDQSTENMGEGAVLGQTATLELDAAEVEMVVASEAMGLLSLSLRSFADNDEAARIVEVAAPPPPPPPLAPPVRIFRNGIIEQVDIR